MTKIMATLGPRSRSVDTIEACLKAGMSGKFQCGSLVSFKYASRISLLRCFLLTFSFCIAAVARFDFSCLGSDYHQETIDNLRIATRKANKLCAVSKYIDLVHELELY